MYLWLVLSTFLAILAGYTLPMRSDSSEKMDVPVASAYIMKMEVNHRLAMDYVKANRWPYYCGGATLSDGEYIEECEEENKVGYSVGRVTADMISEHVPPYFTFDEDNYISTILCYYADGSEAGDCSSTAEEGMKRYLLTYGDVHQKWIASNDISAGGGGATKPKVTPRSDVLQGFNDYFMKDEPVGYVVKENDGNSYIINYSGEKVFKLPGSMYDQMEASNICNKNFNGSCIAHLNAI